MAIRDEPCLRHDNIVLRAGLAKMPDLLASLESLPDEVPPCLSVYCWDGDSPDDLVDLNIAAPKLRARPRIRLARVKPLIEKGFFVVPTGQYPHYSLVLPHADDVEESFKLFRALVGPIRENPGYRKTGQ